jgi:hypothetical protein
MLFLGVVTSASGHDTNKRIERLAEINRLTNEVIKKIYNHCPWLNKDSTHGIITEFESLQYLFLL